MTDLSSLRNLYEQFLFFWGKLEPQLQEAAARNFVIVFAMDKGRVDYPIASRATQHWHAITTATRMKPPCISQGLRLKAVLHTVIDFESEELKLYWPAPWPKIIQTVQFLRLPFL